MWEKWLEAAENMNNGYGFELSTAWFNVQCVH